MRDILDFSDDEEVIPHAEEVLSDRDEETCEKSRPQEDVGSDPEFSDIQGIGSDAGTNPFSIPPGHSLVVLPPGHRIIDEKLFQDILDRATRPRESAPLAPAADKEVIFLRVIKGTVIGDINCKILPDPEGDRLIEWIPGEALKIYGKKYENQGSFWVLVGRQIPHNPRYKPDPSEWYFEVQNQDVFDRLTSPRKPVFGKKSIPHPAHPVPLPVPKMDLRPLPPAPSLDRQEAIRNALSNGMVNYKSQVPATAMENRVETIEELTRNVKAQQQAGTIGQNPSGSRTVARIPAAMSAKDNQVRNPAQPTRYPG